MDKYILAIDQGTTSTRAILFNHYGQALCITQKEVACIFPYSGWVEVDAEKLSGKYIREVERKELPQEITESQIVEYYNRKL